MTKGNSRKAGNWVARGDELRSQKRYEEALEAYDEAIRINPWYADVWRHKADMLKKLRRYGEALEVYDEIIKIDPLNAKAWYLKGVALRVLKRWTDAREAFHTALGLGYSDANEALENMRREDH
jgi:tetratricopeptide (TPR) repeat protein